MTFAYELERIWGALRAAGFYRDCSLGDVTWRPNVGRASGNPLARLRAHWPGSTTDPWQTRIGQDGVAADFHVHRPGSRWGGNVDWYAVVSHLYGPPLEPHLDALVAPAGALFTARAIAAYWGEPMYAVQLPVGDILHAMEPPTRVAIAETFRALGPMGAAPLLAEAGVASRW